MKKLTQEEFLAKAYAVHGERYDYSQVVYKTAKSKIKISCAAHGDFEQEASSHITGCGCPKCGDEAVGATKRRWNTSSFIARCQEIHPKLDFSRSVFSTVSARIDFDCPAHGPQSARAARLLNGNVCRACGNEKLRGSRKDREAWLVEFRAAHGAYYDYSLVPASFVGSLRLSITCPTHGLFSQSANNHRMGKGCIQCHYNRVSARQRKGREAWLVEFRAAHGAYYDYSLVVDTFRAADAYTIICPQHGEFKQDAYNHAIGQGCPECSLANRGFSRSEWTARARGKTPQLYLIKCYNEAELFYKVGITFRSIRARFSSGLPYFYEIIKVLNNGEAGAIYDLEKQIKKRFTYLRYTPNLQFPGATECFSSCDEILAIFSL